MFWSNADEWFLWKLCDEPGGFRYFVGSGVFTDDVVRVYGERLDDDGGS